MTSVGLLIAGTFTSFASTSVACTVVDRIVPVVCTVLSPALIAPVFSVFWIATISDDTATTVSPAALARSTWPSGDPAL